MEDNNPKPNFYDLYHKVGNIEGKLDSALAELKEHETEIDTIKKVQNQMVGKLSISAAFFGFVGGIITMIFGWFLTKKG